MYDEIVIDWRGAGDAGLRVVLMASAFAGLWRPKAKMVHQMKPSLINFLLGPGSSARRTSRLSHCSL
jgi:hypothetical protein